MTRPRRVPFPVQPAGIYRGTVSRVDATGVYVTCERLAPRREYGPVDVTEGPWSSGTVDASGATTDPAGVGDHGSHTHMVPSGRGPLSVGDRVALGLIEGSPDSLIVIARLA